MWYLNARQLAVINEDEEAVSGVLHKKIVLKNFTRFTGKHLRWSLFFNKVAGLRPATLLKKRLWYRCFPVDFGKFLRTSCFKNTAKRSSVSFGWERRLNDALDIIWTSYILAIYVVCPGDCQFSAYAKSSGKLTFLTPDTQTLSIFTKKLLFYFSLYCGGSQILQYDSFLGFAVLLPDIFSGVNIHCDVLRTKILSKIKHSKSNRLYALICSED